MAGRWPASPHTQGRGRLDRQRADPGLLALGGKHHCEQDGTDGSGSSPPPTLPIEKCRVDGSVGEPLLLRHAPGTYRWLFIYLLWAHALTDIAPCASSTSGKRFWQRLCAILA